ncbi:unnamed protein product, partial [Rotaria sordida]
NTHRNRNEEERHVNAGKFGLKYRSIQQDGY